ncbi:heparinase II/III family protein [Clostridium frigoris]|uniref:Heparinase II/III family protein n=1 Tax=Clostridium frigoris TaxID=205327 RepID=A0ABS6BU38_9CLOT|nr:heparinase II/III family protein [Clostridium frigoris]MBU3159850.1 heparinase II/III family protein [Clostridium frigoris]
MIKSLLTEYGLNWTVNRSLYSAKLKMMTTIPATEKIFEKKVDVKRLNIFNIDVLTIKDFLKNISDEKKTEIITVADKAAVGIITGFSSIELDYGNPIKWNYSPLTGVESSKDVKWYSIPDFDAERGDIKVVWEASRFTHFFYFTRAYLITADNKYYNAFSQQLKGWLKSNPYPYGANYKCGQECTLRMINALMAYTVFQSEGLTTVEDESNVTKIVELCYKKVLANFFYAHKCIKNNHTFSEICGLIIGAWCCQDGSGVRRGYKLLDKEIVKQFLPDGGFNQYSFNYQRFTLQIIECVNKIGENTGIYIIEKERIKNSVLLMYQVQAENGDVPNYGSNDGALIFPVTACGYRDFRPVLNTVYAQVEEKRLYVQGDYDEEMLWFCNGKDLALDNIERKASAFNNSGFYTLRHDDGFLMTCLQNFNSRPAHMDQLHIDLWHKGINIFCDSGTYSYASDLGKELTSTSGHNTVKIDNLEQMNKHGAFLIYDWTSCKDVKYDEKSFTGTMISKNGYEHKRQIVKTQQGYEIVDEVIGSCDSSSFFFHTPCDVSVNTYGFELFSDEKKICTVKIDSGDVEIHKFYRSLYYLRKEEINCVIVRCKMNNHRCNMKTSIVLL